MDLQFQSNAISVLNTVYMQIDSERFSKITTRAYNRIAKA